MEACSCEEVRAIVEETIARLGAGKVKKKRAPSAYNLFIGKCMKEGKPMAQCAVEYKQQKN